MYQMLEMSRHDLYSLSSEHLAPQPGAPRASTAPAEPIKPFITIATIIASGLNRWTSGHIAHALGLNVSLNVCVPMIGTQHRAPTPKQLLKMGTSIFCRYLPAGRPLQSQIETDKYGTTELEPWHLIHLPTLSASFAHSGDSYIVQLWQTNI